MRILPNRSALYLLFFVSFFLHPKSFPLLQGCAWWEPDDIKHTSMFIPEMIASRNFDPFFLSIWDYYDSPEDSDPYAFRQEADPGPDMNALNAEEWRSFLRVGTNWEIGRILYEIPESGVDTLLLLARGKTLNVDALYQPAGGKKEWIPAFEYLKLAKRLSKVLRVDEYYWGEPEFDLKELIALNNAFLKGYSTANNDFLKARYAFQYIRTCKVLGLNKEGIEFGRNEFKMTPERSGSMYSRIKGYYAGCLYKNGNFAESNLEFARLYDLGGPYRMTAFQSFHPQNEIEWQQTIQLASSTRDKEILWHLLGVYADPIRGMQELSRLNVESDYLPLLLVRAIQIGEFNSLGNPTYEGDNELYFNLDELKDFTPDPLYSWNKVKKEEFNALLNTINEIGAKRKTDTPLWHLAAAYLLWMNKQFEDATKYIQKASALAPNPAMQNQIRILELLLELERSRKFTETEELKIFERIKQLPGNELRAGNGLRYVLRQIKNIFLERNDPVWAEIAWPTPDAFFSERKDVQPFIDIFLNRDQLNPFRSYLLGRYPLKLQDLYDIQATQEVYNLNFQAAKSIYSKHPEAGLTELYGNPFNFRKVDCHDCDHAMPQKVKYTKRSFVDKMIELQSKSISATDNKEKANNAFLYANGLYNMTLYGNARLVRQTAVNFDYFDANRFAYLSQDNPLQSGPFYDCRPALEYYLKAYQLSSETEFKARCVWMAAKCEHNHWLETEYSSTDNGDFQSGKYFRKLKTDYAQTKYYREVIEECGYFCQFINGAGTQYCIRNKD